MSSKPVSDAVLSAVSAERSGTPSPQGRNLRTGLILASIALVGFLGVFARYWLFG